MPRKALLVAAIGFAFIGARGALAVDQTNAAGVGGIGRAAHVTAGWGRASDDGRASTGLPSRTGAGMIGVTPGGATGGMNKGTDEGFHLSGLGKTMLGGTTGSTMNYVPGRSINYSNIMSGIRPAPLVGARGP